MRIKRFLTIAMAGIILAVGLLYGCAQAEAIPEGVPALETEEVMDYPVLNVYVDNPVLGDEHDFVRIAPWDEDNPTDIANFQADEILIEAGKSYSVMVYYHNAADAGLGEMANAEYAVLVVDYPEALEEGKENCIFGTFAYGTDDTPNMRGANVTIQSADAVKLQPGVILAGDAQDCCALLCDNYGENWSSQNPSALVEDGRSKQAFFFEKITPGYDGAGFVFLRLDAVAIE